MTYLRADSPPVTPKPNVEQNKDSHPSLARPWITSDLQNDDNPLLMITQELRMGVLVSNDLYSVVY